MIGEKIVKILNARSTNPGARFEEVLHRVVQQIVKENNLLLRFAANVGNLKFDFCLPRGIGAYNKQIFVEIKYYKQKVINVILKDLDKQFRPYKDVLFNEKPITNEPLQYILYILPLKLTDNERTRILNRFKKLVNKYEVIIWDLKDLNPYIEKYVEYIIDVVPELKEKGVQSIVEKSIHHIEGNIPRDQTYYKEVLSKSFANDDLVLFLGAGVSFDSGLPTWNGLLSLLLLALIEKQVPEKVNLKLTDEVKASIANTLRNLNDSSPLQSARYINSGLDEDFESQISDILYRNLKDLSNIEILKAIVDVCTPPRKGIGVKAIVNYNFDDIIETILTNSGIKNKPVYSDLNLPTTSELGIFHVHGFLPRNPKEFEDLDSSLLVFSEENYHAIMSEPYNWSNLTQLNFFRENTCLFIGLSGTDPNLRRLLELAKQKTKISKHFIILKRTPVSEFLKDIDQEQLPSEKAIETIVDVHHKLVEVSFDDIGLNVVWVNEFNEIPGIIYNIRR